MLINIDWIQKTDVNLKKKKIEFNVIKSEIFEWLKNLREVFKIILERELLFSREEIDHEIKLKTEKIKPSSLILIKSEEQHIVKKYLNKIIRKKWIRISKSLMTASLFLIFKSGTEEKRFVIDYRKLNEEIVTDSTSLLLIEDMLDQMKE